MLIARLSALALITLCVIPAQAQTLRLPKAVPENIPPGITVIPPGQHGRDQWVIPRYANGKSHPAGSLLGWGPASVVHGTAKTPTLPLAAVVVTEEFAGNLSQWQANNSQQSPAVLQPVIRDVTIAGEPDRWSTGNVSDAPLEWNPADKYPDLYDGLLWKASGGLVENVNFFCIPGTAAVFTRGGPPAAKSGALGPFDNVKLKIWSCNVARAYRGFDIRVVDAVVGRLSGHSLRDYGIKFTSGAAQIDGALHFWGGEKAVWFAATAGPCWGGPIYAESTPVGVAIDSAGNRLRDIFSHSCSQIGIHLRGMNNHITSLMIGNLGQPQPVGVQVEEQFNQIHGGTIEVPKGGRGIVLVRRGGHGLRLRDLRIAGAPDTTLIDCTGTGATTGQDGRIDGAVLDVHLSGGAVGLDLVRDDGTSRLGVRNRITITTPISGGPKKVIDLPARWDSSNVIVVNGVELRPPSRP